MKTEDILNEREKTHGDFERVAKTCGELKKLIKRECAPCLSAQQILSLEIICLKMARIIHGDPSFDDHWDDIAGYAMLGKGKSMFEPDTEWPKDIEWPKMANTPCDHQAKERKYFTDTAEGLQTVMTVDYCHECNKMHIVDCEHKEAKSSTYPKEDPNYIGPAFLLNKLKIWLEMMLGPKRVLEKHEHEYYSKKIAYCFRIYADAAFERGRKTGRAENSTSSKPFYQCDTCKQDKTQNEIEYSCPSIEKWPLRSAICKDCYETGKKNGKYQIPEMERVGDDIKFWCNGCEQQKTGKPQDVGILKDGTPMLNCENCCEKLTRAVKGIFKKGREGEKKWDCIKDEPDYSIRHMFSCLRKRSGCDCVSFCKVKAGYKT